MEILLPVNIHGRSHAEYKRLEFSCLYHQLGAVDTCLSSANCTPSPSQPTPMHGDLRLPTDRYE